MKRKHSRILSAALAAESWKTVLPQYTDVVLKYKGARDETSIERIDIVPDGRSVGLAACTAKNNKVVQKHYAKVMELFRPAE